MRPRLHAAAKNGEHSRVGVSQFLRCQRRDSRSAPSCDHPAVERGERLARARAKQHNQSLMRVQMCAGVAWKTVTNFAPITSP